VPPDRETLDLIASCLDYPGPETGSLARRAAGRTAGDHVALARALWDLAVFVEHAPPGEAEERYTTLFDLNPVCTLHVGYQVFGDSYPRGAFIAGLAAELRKAGLGRGGDLPDYLPTVLRLLGRLSLEDARVLSDVILRPALKKMAQALAASTSPWSGILDALPAFLSELSTEIAAPHPAAGASSEVAHA
jgi:nitrate reductase delta subunit